MKNDNTIQRITITNEQYDKITADIDAAEARAIAWKNADAATRKKILNDAHDAHMITDNNGIIENGTITVAVVEQISECGSPVNVIEHITRKYTIRKNNDHGRSCVNRQYIISYKGQRHTVAFLNELTCIDVSAGY